MQKRTLIKTSNSHQRVAQTLQQRTIDMEERIPEITLEGTWRMKQEALLLNLRSLNSSVTIDIHLPSSKLMKAAIMLSKTRRSKRIIETHK
jgi:hypothetical protein